MSRKASFIILLVGIALLLTAGGLGLSYLQEDYRAGQSSNQLLSQLRKMSSYLSQSGETELPDSFAAVKQETIGVLEVPKFSLELPVLASWSEELLKVSVCRFEGNVRNHLIIAGHNFKSHFAKIPSLYIGDEIRLTDNEGTLYRYEVTEISEIAGDNLEGLLAGKWNLTLFTCNFDGTKRILVRCAQV